MAEIPARGTPEHREYVSAVLRQCAEAYGIPVGRMRRSELREWLRRTPGVSLSRGDLDAIGGYRAARQAAEGAPLSTLQEGYRVSEIRTSIGKDGQIRVQSLKERPRGARGEVVDQVPEGHRISGVSTLVDTEGNVLGQWVKTSASHVDREAALRAWAESLADTVTPRETTVRPPPPGDRDLLAVYPIGDHHVGMLAWGPEAGQSHDLRRSERLLKGAFDTLLQAGPQCAEALIVNLGDFLHADDSSNRTPRGNHALDVDGRFQRVFRAAADMLVYAIVRALESHDRVRVWSVSGNHDPHLSVALCLVLETYFSNEPRVIVEPNYAPRYYYRFGRVLLGSTHGDGPPRKQLPLLMATERPQDWSESTERYWLLGHLHHQIEEHVGATVEVFQTLIPPDAYAAKNGYLSGRSLHRIVFHRQWGRVGRSQVSAEYVEHVYGGSDGK